MIDSEVTNITLTLRGAESDILIIELMFSNQRTLRRILIAQKTKN